MTVQLGVVMVFADVVTVDQKANALPFQDTRFPIVIPAALIAVPIKVELAQSVVAQAGVQKTSQADAPEVVTIEFAVVVSAQVILKI